MGAFIPKGSTAKALPAINKIQLKQVQIIEGDGDPNDLPVVAQDGSIFMSKTAGRVYFKSSTVWVDNTQALIDLIATKGQPNGIAPLDVNGKVTESYLPSSIVGALKFKGTWDASTNTPALASGVGANGDIYIVSVAGATDLDGIADWNVGDWAVFSGTVWRQIDNTDLVVSVNGKSGVVVLNHADLSAIAGTGEYHFSADEHEGLEGVDSQVTGILLGPSAGNRSRLRQSGTDAVQLEAEIGNGVGVTARGPNAPTMPDTVLITNSTNNVRLTQDGTVKVSAPDYEANIDDDTLTTGKYVDDAIALTLWSTQVIDSSMSPYTVTSSRNNFILDTSSGDVTVLLPNISTALSGSENRFIKSSNLNKAVVTTVGGVDLVGSKTSQYIWEDNKGFSVVMSSCIGEYVITQDNRNVDTFETPVGVWAKTSSIEHWNLAISTLGTGATFTGSNHGATLTTGTTASTIYSHEVSTEELIADQNYFAFVTSCSTAGIFDLVVEGWNGSAWSEVGTLVKPFEAGTALNGLIPFFKTGYTKWRLKLTNSGTTASLTCTIAKGEWTDDHYKSVQYNGDPVIVERSGNAGEAITADVTDIPFGIGADKITSFTIPFDNCELSVVVNTLSTANVATQLALYKNGVFWRHVAGQDSESVNASDKKGGVVVSSDVKKGDVIRVRANIGITLVNNTNYHWITFTATPIGTSKGIVAQADMDNSIGEILISANSTAPFGFASTLNKSFGKTGADYSGDNYRKLYEYMWSLPAINVSTTASKGYRLNAASKGANWLADWDAGNVIFVDLSGDHLRIDGALAGSHVDDAFQGHHHDVYHTLQSISITSGSAAGYLRNSSSPSQLSNGVNGVTNARSDGTNGTPRTANETRVKATYHYAYIRYSNAPATVIAPVAVVVDTEPVPYTPVIEGFGTPTNVAFQCNREGAFLHVIGSFNSGTPTASLASIGLPTSIFGALTINLTNFGADNTTCGTVATGFSSTTSFGTLALVNKTTSDKIFFGRKTSTADDQTIANGNAVAAAGNKVSINFKVPIEGWKVMETAHIATNKEEIHKHATYLSSNETEAGYCEFTGKKIYKRTIYFPTTVSATNASYALISTGITPINSINYSGTLWELRSYTAAGSSTAATLVYFDKSSGYVGVSVATYVVGAGTRIVFEYTKP